jgi:type IV secretion system protein VirB8
MFKYIKQKLFANTAVPTLIPSEDYYQAAKSWYQEHYETTVITKYRYQLMTILLSLLLTLSLIAITVMMPLKQYVYRLLSIDHQTGEVTELKHLDGETFSENWVVTRYFLNQYVINRESYHFDDIRRSFNQVLALSNTEIGSQYRQSVIVDNPNGAINTLKNNYYKTVNVISINQLNDKTALVRFDVSTHANANTNDVKTESFQAVVKWDYTDVAMSLSDRDLNPLGFNVTYYQVSPVFVNQK